MTLQQMISPMLGHNMYLLRENGRGLLIDPYDGDETEAWLGGAVLDLMLVTHEHFDHISGVNALRARHGCPLLASETCQARMQDPAKNYAKYYEAYCQVQKGMDLEKITFDAAYSCRADETFSGEHTLTWQGHTLVLREAPGHSPGGCLILVDGEILFSGDTLLPEETPVLRFPGGSPKAFREKTLPYLLSLPREIPVYPGHGESFRLGEHHLLRERSHLC